MSTTSSPLSAPFPTNEILPKSFLDAKIFIPTKGRAFLRNATWTTLLGGAGEEFDESKAVPFTLVVEPQEAHLYQNVFQRVIALKLATIEVLPQNDQGVSFARNYILTNLAPKPEESFKKGTTSWFWIMDDDISQLLVTVGAGRLAPLRASDCINEVYRRMAQVIAHERSEALPVPVGLFALEYLQFAFQSPPRHILCNSYCNIAVMMSLSRLPEGIRYRFRVREDYDFALQVIRSGRTNLRFHDLGFKVPSMSKQHGGMTSYYISQKNKDVRLQNKLFLECWGGDAKTKHGRNQGRRGGETSWCREVVKGASTSANNNHVQRYDIKVQWSRLNDILGAIEFLRSLPGKSTTYENGLVAPLEIETNDDNKKLNNCDDDDDDDEIKIKNDIDDDDDDDDDDDSEQDVDNDDDENEEQKAGSELIPRRRFREE